MFSKVRSRFWGRLDVKLTTYYTIIVLLITAVLGGFYFYRLQHNLLKQIDSLLRDEAYELLHEIEDHGGDIAEGCKVYAIDIMNRKSFTIIFQVQGPSGKIIYRSQNAANDTFPMLKDGSSNYFTFTIPNTRTVFRFYQTRVAVNNKSTFTIQIATNKKQIENILENSSQNLLSVITIILVLSISCGMIVSRKPCSIIKNITTVTNRITSQNLQERLPVPNVNDEVRSLSITINSMIERLEKSFREVKQFTSDVSHELRTPLFSLKGEMEVTLTQKRTKEEYREVLYNCLERINLLIQMVNDLFLVSRFDMQKVDLDRSYLNLSEIVKDLYDFFLPVAQEKKLQFSIIKCDDIVFQGDKTRIHQLFSNLLDNAIKFTPEGGVVGISLVRQNQAIQFTVQDTGIGIPEDAFKKIFDRFYQVNQARNNPLGGTGLGLHICKRIVDVYGGDLTVERNTDNGITVIVTLPAPE